MVPVMVIVNVPVVAEADALKVTKLFAVVGFVPNETVTPFG